VHDDCSTKLGIISSARCLEFIEATKGDINWSRHHDVLAKLHTADMLGRSLVHDEIAGIVRETYRVRNVRSHGMS
jgi:hypothetical protein